MPDKKKDHMLRFRKENPRIDYYPTSDALAAIEQLQALHPKCSRREVVDTLVEAGAKVLAPKKEVSS